MPVNRQQMKRYGVRGLLTMSYFTLKSGEKLYYEDRGEGPDTLVMLHGWTSSHEVYVKTGRDAAEAGQVHHL